jgi:hypothetical protein
MNEFSLFEMPEEVTVVPYLPDEIFDSEEYEIHVYYEQHES